MSLVFQIGANIAALQATLGKADSVIKSFASKAESSLMGVGKGIAGSLASIVKGAAIGVGAAIAAAPIAAAAGMKAAMDAGGALTDLSANTGETIEELMKLRLALDDAGVGADQAQAVINRLQKALTGVNEDGEPTNAIFAKLGLALSDFKGKGAVEQLQIVAAKIRGIKDPAERTAAAMALFGKSGASMLALFNDADALGSAAESLGRQAHLMQESAATFDAVSDLLGHAGLKIQGFFVGMASQVAPVLLPILERLNSLDFAAWGEQIGLTLAVIGKFFSSEKLGSALTHLFKGALMNTVNVLYGGLLGAFQAAGQLLGEIIVQAVDLFSMVTRMEFWTGMLNILAGAATKFAAWMVDALGEPIIALHAGMQWVIEVLRNGLITAFNGPIALLRAGVDLVMQDLINGLLKIPGMKKLLGMEEVNKTFEELHEEAKKNGIMGGQEKTDANYQDIYKKAKADGANLFGLNSKGLHALADEELSKGSADLGPVFKEYFESLKGSFGRIGESFMKGFDSGKIFDFEKEYEAFNSVFVDAARSLLEANEKTEGATTDSPFNLAAAKLAKGGDDGKGGKRDGLQVVSSTLARVGGGGYSGGGGLLDRERNGYLKRIVSNTTPKPAPQGLKTGKLQTGSLFE